MEAVIVQYPSAAILYIGRLCEGNENRKECCQVFLIRCQCDWQQYINNVQIMYLFVLLTLLTCCDKTVILLESV